VKRQNWEGEKTVAQRHAITVLAVDDEESFLEALGLGLEREGFEVHVARDGVEALESFARVEPDIVLLDVMLPRLSGIDVCQKLRKETSVPIIMLSAKGEEIDAVVGLEVGADDYITKPYRLRELVARIRAALRRTRVTGAESGASLHAGLLTSGDICLDPDRYEVTVRDEALSLPLKEFELLKVLMENVGHVLTRQRLIECVWGFDYVGDTKTLDVHIKRLRSRVEKDPANPEAIITIRGLGYKLVDTSLSGTPRRIMGPVGEEKEQLGL